MARLREPDHLWPRRDWTTASAAAGVHFPHPTAASPARPDARPAGRVRQRGAMTTITVIVLADTGAMESFVRVANASIAVKGFPEGEDTVQPVFDGAGTKKAAPADTGLFRRVIGSSRAERATPSGARRIGR